MAFPYKADREQARQFVTEYLELTQTDPALFDGWRKLGLVVAFRLEDLGLDFHLDCTSGREVRIHQGYPETQAGAVLKLSSDVFHDLFTGRLNVGMAFFRRLVRTEGNVAGVLRLSTLMPKNIKLYRELLSRRGVG